MNTPSQLVFNLYEAATNINCGYEAAANLDALNAALIAIEEYFVIGGVWRLEALRAGDLKAISRLLNRAAKGANQ